MRAHLSSPSQPTNSRDVNFEITTSFFRAQDSTGASFDEYKGERVASPAGIFFIIWGHSFYWPKSVPLPPMGSPDVRGIVAGSLFDSNTPYRWTQQMRAAFPNADLLTSQSITHAIPAISDVEEKGRYDCQQHIRDYLGDVNFT
jgi:TAP-like protein